MSSYESADPSQGFFVIEPGGSEFQEFLRDRCLNNRTMGKPLTGALFARKMSKLKLLSSNY